MSFDDILEGAVSGLEAPDLRKYREAIAGIESGGDYKKLGPVTKSGDRALGKYQVMTANLPEWSKEALGREVGPKEFLASPELQDKVFDHKFGQYLKEHGPADAASLWFTGKPLAEGAGRKDQLGTSGKSYVDQYLTGLEKSVGLSGAVSTAPKVESLEDIEKGLKEYFPAYGAEAPPETAATLPSPAATLSQPSWGGLLNLVNASLLGQGTKIVPTAQTQKSIWDAIAAGKSPQEALLAARVAKPELIRQQEEAKAAWEKEHTGMALATEIGGQALPMIAGIGAANMGLRGLGALAPRVAPAMEFLTGAARGGPISRTVGDAATGAWQGALGNAIVGQDPTQGALWGGALGAPAGWLSRALTAPERATARPEVAQAAEHYLGLGGELPPAAIVENPTTKKMLKSIGGKGEASAVENFNGLLADRIGARGIMEAEGVKGLTPTVLDQAKQQLYSGFDTFAAQRGVAVDRELITDLHSILLDAKTDLAAARPETLKEVQKAVQRVWDVAMGNPNFTMSGKEFRALTSSGSALDKLFDVDHMATPFAERLKESLYSALERTLPEAKDEINTLRQQYRDYLRLKKVAPTDPTGLINPKKVASRYGKDTDEFGQIAQMGHYLPALDAAGGVKGHAPGFVASLAERVSPGLGKNALGVGIGLAAGGGLPPAAAWALSNPVSAAQVLGLAGLGYAGKHALAARYGSPEFTKKIIENSLRPKTDSPFINPLLPFIPALSQRNP